MMQLILTPDTFLNYYRKLRFNINVNMVDMQIRAVLHFELKNKGVVPQKHDETSLACY